MLDIKKFRQEIKDIYGADGTLIPMNCSLTNHAILKMSDVELISGFSGSNGIAIISKDRAILVVDGRYTTQASLEIDNNVWEIRTFSETNIIEITKEIISTEETLLISSNSHSYRFYLELVKSGLNIKTIDEHCIVKHRDNTSLSNDDNNKLIMSENKDLEKKLDLIRSKIKDENEAILIGDKNTVSWIFELRRSKLNTYKSPVARALAIVSKHDAKIIKNAEDINEFKHYNIKADYASVPAYFIIKNKLNTTDFKFVYNGLKSNSEIKAQKEAAYETSLSFIKALAYINFYVENDNKISEEEAIKLFSHDKAIDYSFHPICASGKNTSIVHYSPKENCLIENNALFLFDGGFHFKNGTSDMTRTLYIGANPPEYFKKIYTIILKSLIFYTLYKFKERTRGSELDAICRYHMWQNSIDYNFGTGHGVGNYRTVHEKPSISRNSNDEILANMVTTIEPGYYTNEFGIRLENMLVSEKDGDYIKFGTINYIPFCQKLIDLNLLSNNEKLWLNSYNNKIRNEIFPIFIEKDAIISQWIAENTLSYE